MTGRAALWGNGTSAPCLDVDPLVALLAELPKDPTQADSYSLIPVHAWSHDYADVVEYDALATRGHILNSSQQLL